MGGHARGGVVTADLLPRNAQAAAQSRACLLYTSDAADERSSVDLGGRRIIKKKISEQLIRKPSTRTHK